MSAVSSEPFGTTRTGQVVERLRMSNAFLQVEVLTWGATIRALRVKDPAEPGSPGTDVVLGYPTLDGYEADRAFLGAVVGRYANRIAHGTFTLDGLAHRLPRNQDGHTLHGGPEGFHRQLWTATPTGSDEAPGVLLEHVSPEGAPGFPGTLRATCRYVLDGAALRIELRAVTDRPTFVNLTQHAYFNLAGTGSGTVEAHELWLAADRYLPTDSSGIPTADPQPVDGTPFDFRQPNRLGARLRQPHPDLVAAGGYDHWMVLDGDAWERPTARLTDPDSGRTLEVSTDQPGIQLYSANDLDGSAVSAHGLLRQTDGVCLETQQAPDGPNRPELGVTPLRPGDEYVARTVWRFSRTSGRGSADAGGAA